MSRKKRSLKKRLIGLVVVLVVASVWFSFRRSLDSVKEIVKPANKTVLAEKSDTKAESEPKDDGSAWYSAEDEAYMVPLNEGLKVPEQRLNRYAYITSYNAGTRNPNWVAWTLTADHVDGEYSRGGHKFMEDMDVPEPRAAYSDIREGECGYQRGHMCPAGDNKWSYKAQKEAFLMTNICPQNGDLNQRDWKYLEEACRDWASKYGKIYIVSGPVFRSKNPQTVGEHEVSVPDAFFKVVLTLGKKQDTPKSIGFIYNNVEGRHKMEYYARSVDEVEKMTGLNFFSHLDDKVENRIEAECDLGSW